MPILTTSHQRGRLSYRSKISDLLFSPTAFIASKNGFSDDCISNIVQINLDMAFESLPEAAVPSDENFQMLIENLSEDFAKFLYSKNKAFQDFILENIE